MNQYHIDENSFGGERLPTNWQEIAQYLNEKIDEILDAEGPDILDPHFIANGIWNSYFAGDYDDAPPRRYTEYRLIKSQSEYRFDRHHIMKGIYPTSFIGAIDSSWQTLSTFTDRAEAEEALADCRASIYDFQTPIGTMLCVVDYALEIIDEIGENAGEYDTDTAQYLPCAWPLTVRIRGDWYIWDGDEWVDRFPVRDNYTESDLLRYPDELRHAVESFWEPGYDYASADFWASYDHTMADVDFVRACVIYDALRRKEQKQ